MASLFVKCNQNQALYTSPYLDFSFCPLPRRTECLCRMFAQSMKQLIVQSVPKQISNVPKVKELFLIEIKGIAQFLDKLHCATIRILDATVLLAAFMLLREDTHHLTPSHIKKTQSKHCQTSQC